jgi:hypothetical protein
LRVVVQGVMLVHQERVARVNGGHDVARRTLRARGVSRADKSSELVAWMVSVPVVNVTGGSP